MLEWWESREMPGGSGAEGSELIYILLGIALLYIIYKWATEGLGDGGYDEDVEKAVKKELEKREKLKSTKSYFDDEDEIIDDEEDKWCEFHNFLLYEDGTCDVCIEEEEEEKEQKKKEKREEKAEIKKRIDGTMTAKEKREVAKFKVGTQVHHKLLGNGEIISIEKRNPELSNIIEIMFASGTRMKFPYRNANLTIGHK